MELIKREDRYDLYNNDGHKIASSFKLFSGAKLSEQNCKELFGDFCVEMLAEETYREYPTESKLGNMVFNKDVHAPKKRKAYIKGFNKALELTASKKYTEKDIKKAMDVTANYELKRDAQSYQEKIDFLKSLTQEPNMIEVEFVMIDSEQAGDGLMWEKVKQDKNGCLILKMSK